MATDDIHDGLRCVVGYLLACAQGQDGLSLAIRQQRQGAEQAIGVAAIGETGEELAVTAHQALDKRPRIAVALVFDLQHQLSILTQHLEGQVLARSVLHQRLLHKQVVVRGF